MDYKPIIKRALLRMVQDSGAEQLRDKIWAGRGVLPAAVLLFHRVTDNIPGDGITVTTERFRTIIRHLRDHYRVESLTHLLDDIERNRIWPSRTVVVTFDDGYKDNYEHAAPILAEYGIPATFFVAVDVIGTERVMSWDEHLRGRVPWMSWGQVRELHAHGFEIGSHTLTHPDLGKVRGSQAWQELVESKARLEDALGTKQLLFAYPFGGRQNITEENRGLVRKAGYRCCCSAYGGFVRLGSDPFDLRRIGVNNWFASTEELDFEIRIAAPWRWFRPATDSSILKHS